jgi:hypothetical protein
VWWYVPVIPALWRLRQEDHEFKASIDYATAQRSCQRKEKESVRKIQRKRGREREGE